MGGKEKRDTGAASTAQEAAKSVGFWFNVFRVAALIGAAGSILTLNRNGEVFPWDELACRIVNGFADFLDKVFWPLEWAIEWLIARFGWDWTLGPMFKPMLLNLSALYGSGWRAARRLGLHRSDWFWAGTAVVFFGAAILAGIFLSGAKRTPTEEFATAVAAMALWGGYTATPGFRFYRTDEFTRSAGRELLYILLAVLAFSVWGAAGSIRDYVSTY